LVGAVGIEITVLLQTREFCGAPLLLNMTHQITSNLELREALRAISRNIREVVQCDLAVISLLEGESGNLRLHNSPGCQHCKRVETALQEIGDWIMQRESPSCTHIVSPDGSALSYAPARANRPDVVVRIFMAHRHQWGQPSDESEERCLREIEQAITEPGAYNGGWSEP